MSDESATRFRLVCSECLNDDVFTVPATQYDYYFRHDGTPKPAIGVLTKGWAFRTTPPSGAINYFCPECVYHVKATG